MNNNSTYSKVILLNATFFLVMMGVAVFHEDGILTVFKFEGQMDTLESRNEALREENEQLQRTINALRSDPYAIEKIAREKLNLAKPDEKVYRILPYKSSQRPPA